MPARRKNAQTKLDAFGRPRVVERAVQRFARGAEIADQLALQDRLDEIEFGNRGRNDRRAIDERENGEAIERGRRRRRTEPGFNRADRDPTAAVGRHIRGGVERVQLAQEGRKGRVIDPQRQATITRCTAA